MKRRPPRKTGRVIMSALPLGYGPAAKLVVIAGELRRLGAAPVFVGRGIAHELAARSGVFEDVVDDPAGSRACGLLDGAAAAVSLMDREFAALALESGTPLHVVDSLLWMRADVPEEFTAGRHLWAQDFFGVRQRAAQLQSAPTVVGPIVGPAHRPRRNGGAGLVVNLGGYASAYSGNGSDGTYAEFVVRGILASPWAAGSGGSVTVLGGARCVAECARRHPGLRCDSLPHSDSCDAFANAAAVLTAPGLTATLECFESGVPTFFLPPENYSQWLILEHLRQAGLAPGAFHWRDCGEEGIGPGLTMEERVPRVQAAIARGAADPGAASGFQAALAAYSGMNGSALAQRQGAWYSSLGACGSGEIAAGILNREQ